MTADLPAALRLIYHRDEPAPRDVPLEHVYADLTFPPREPLPFVALNMVQTLDGAAAIGGRAWTIGTAVDHHLYRTLHGAVDAVLAGAGTLRAEDVVAGTHPHLRARREAAGLPPTPTAVVLTAAASFDETVLGKRFFTGREYPSLLLTTERARPADIDRVRALGVEVAVVAADDAGLVDVQAALRHLAARGMRRVLAEGGPRLATALLRRGLVDELFLTLTVRLSGDPAAPRILAGEAAIALDPISVYHYMDRAGALREIYLRLDASPAGRTPTGV